MALRPSNRRRNQWAVRLLDIEATDRFLEVGFGPGIAIREAAKYATNGKVMGVDHSGTMVGLATRRNRVAVQRGTVELRQMEVDALRALVPPFDKVLVVNALGFWPQPVDRLCDIGSIMSEGGVIAIVSQPRCRGATSEHTERAEQEIRRQLRESGFSDLRSERLELHPPAVCVLATRLNVGNHAADESSGSGS
jgi:SAM-dependent methyltransferase